VLFRGEHHVAVAVDETEEGVLLVGGERGGERGWEGSSWGDRLSGAGGVCGIGDWAGRGG
jgi:hypothetical protein